VIGHFLEIADTLNHCCGGGCNSPNARPDQQSGHAPPEHKCLWLHINKPKYSL